MILAFDDDGNDMPAMNENVDEDDTLPAITVIRHIQEMMMVRASFLQSLA